MLVFTLAISCFSSVQFSCSVMSESPVWLLPSYIVHGPNIPGSYAVLFFIALDFTSITSHIHNLVLLLLWLHLFILSGVIFPLISSSIFGTYLPEEFIFQCPNFFAFLYCSCVSQGKNTEVVCNSLLLWTMFWQNSPPWWEGNRQEGQGSPNGGNSLQLSDIFFLS